MQTPAIHRCHPYFNLRRTVAAAIASTALFTSPFASGSTAIWNGTTDALWSTATNWDTSLIPGTGDTAIFSNAGNGNTILDLSSGVTINSILFDTGTAAAYTIGSGAVGSQTLTLNNGGAITIASSVTTSQLFNSAIVLGTDGTAQTFTLTNDSATVGQLLTIAGGITGSTGAGIKTLAVTGAGNTTLSGIIGNGTTGTVALTKNGAGTLTLSGVNTYTGGVTLNLGRLNINHAAALGNTATGTLTINGGTIDNTSGAAITTTTAKAQTWAGDFNFAGTNNLNFNSGVVTLTGAGSRTVTVDAGTLTVGRITSASTGLNVAGPGILAITTTVASNIGGTLNVASGSTLQFNTGAAAGTTQDFIATGLTGSGTVQNGGGAIRWLFINNTADNTFSGVLQNGGAAGLGLNKGGTGTLTLSGASTYTDRTTVRQGTLRVTGSITASNTTGNIEINAASGTTARMWLDGGSVLVGGSFAGNANLVVGNTTGGTGILDVTSGSLTTGGAAAFREIHVGRAGFGTANISGGTISIGGFLVAGITTSGAVGIWNITGGAISTLSSKDAAGTLGASTGTTGVMNISGGSFSSVGTSNNTGLYVGENGTGILNVSGTGEVNVGGAAGSRGLVVGLANNVAASGIVNLGAVGSGGGTITASRVQKLGAAASGIFNFHGGTLKVSTAPNATFFTGLSSAYVYGEGGTIDTNGQSVTIGQSLLAPTDTGVSAISSSATGFTTTGYTAAPLVTISGGTGSGATAVATIDASGNLTGIIITNPGVYTVAPTTVTLRGGGFSTTSSSTVAITTAANTSGGITKISTGTLTLTGTNTYTGATTISAGTLQLGNGTTDGTLSNSSNITNNAALIYNIIGTQSYSGVISGTGSVEKTGGGTQTLTGNSSYGGGTTVSTGTLAVTQGSAGATPLGSGVATLAGGTLSVRGAPTNTQSYVNNLSVIANSTLDVRNSLDATFGTLEIAANTLTVTGDAGAKATFGGTTLMDNATFSPAADITLTLGAVGELFGVSLTKTGAGTLNLTGAGAYSGGTTVSNGTLLATNTTGSATGSGNVMVDTSARLGGNGLVGLTPGVAIANNDITVNSGGFLMVGTTHNISTGSGGLASDFALLTGGTTGVSSGTVTLDGTVELDIFANTAGVDAMGSPVENDRLIFDSFNQVILSGTLQVKDTTGLSATTWLSGDTWQLFDWSNVSPATPVSGGFTVFDLPALNAGLSWDTSQLYTVGTIIISVPEPGRAVMLLIGLAFSFLRRRRRHHSSAIAQTLA